MPDLMQYLNLGGQTPMPANESDEYDKKNFKKTVVYEMLVKACTKVDQNLPSFNAELSEYLKNAPNIKDGYNWERILKQVRVQNRVHMRIVMKVALMKTKVKACAKVDENFMLFVF